MKKKLPITLFSFCMLLCLSACEESKESMQMQVSDGYIQYYDGTDWQNLIAVEELRGPAGQDGKDGQNGRDGIDGNDGEDGKDGKDGASGAPGAPGKDGVDGEDGADGKDGAPGKDGTVVVQGQDSVKQCAHILERISQEDAEIEKYSIYESLWRTTETYSCNKCGAKITMYYDWIRTTPFWELPSTPTPEPTMPPPTPVPAETPPSELPSTPTPEPSTTPEPGENPMPGQCEHDFEAVEVIAPTCTSLGITRFQCSICGTSYYNDSVDALGHEWDEGVYIQEPTENSVGIKRYTCSRCGSEKTEIENATLSATQEQVEGSQLPDL